VWTIAGTLTGDSRKKFDTYFSMLISGTDAAHPKPKSVKLTKVYKNAVFTSQITYISEFFRVMCSLKEGPCLITSSRRLVAHGTSGRT